MVSKRGRPVGLTPLNREGRLRGGVRWRVMGFIVAYRRRVEVEGPPQRGGGWPEVRRRRWRAVGALRQGAGPGGLPGAVGACATCAPEGQNRALRGAERWPLWTSRGCFGRFSCIP